MLIRFAFKNFKSFKEENVLDMEATSLKEHEYNVAKTDQVNLLKVAAIYGANASGKTNVLQAFDYMKKRILVSDDSKKNSPIDEDNVYSFMINNEPISLEVEILAKNNKIYKQNYIGMKFQNLNFENFNSNSENELAIAIAKDYVNKNITSANTNGLIIMGESGVGKTHLACSIANELIKNGIPIIYGTLINLLAELRNSYDTDNNISEMEINEKNTIFE